jgi:hypothetical protein
VPAHALENVRCTLAGPGSYGQLRCDSSGVIVCPVPSSSAQLSSLESEVSSEELSSEIFITSSATGSSVESRLEKSSEEPQGSGEFISSSEEQSSYISEESSEVASAFSSEGFSAYPCESSNECESLGCPGCCSVHITEVKIGSGTSFCPPAPFTDREIILWFYTLDELAAFCRGHGQYCDFIALPATTCDPISKIAILDFVVCCGCDHV